MHMVSSIRFKKAQERAKYFDGVIENLSQIMRKIPEQNRPLENPPVFVVISSDRGMAGAYNINILNKTYEKITMMKSPKLITLGRKAKSFFEKKGIDLNINYTGIEGELPDEILSEIATKIIDEYENGSQIFVAYTHFNGISQLEPMIVRLLPAPKKENLEQYIYEPQPQELIQKLIGFYVKMSLRGFYYHSYVCEHGARMISMERATENADEILEELEFTFHQRRKNIITGEIAEIVSGAQSFRH